MVKLVNGFNAKCSNEDYHADREYKSSSALKLILKNPREYHRLYVMNEAQNFNKDALSVGSYTHTRILEPHLIDVEYAIWTGSRRSGEEWKKFEEENAGKTIITASQKGMVEAMLREYEQSHVILGHHGNEVDVPLTSFFSGGEAEETLCGEIDGYKLKCRFDYRKISEDFASINDVKTTRESIKNASVKDVEAICSAFDYEISAALYVDLAEQATGTPHDFYFMFLSKSDFGCRIFKASDTMLERGRVKYKEAIRLLKEAEATNIYFKNTIEELG